MRKSGKQQGVAMVVVLWMIMVMMMIISSLLYSSRTQVQMMDYSRFSAQARAFADAATRYTIMQLYLPQDERQFQMGSSFNEWEYEGNTASVRIVGENGLVDLNKADRKLLQQILFKAGIKDDQAESLLDAIEDFKDPDDLVRLNGAEDQTYEQEGYAAGAKDAPFERMEELQQVMGVDADIYQRLSQYLTVTSGIRGVNPMLAPRDVLLLIAEGDEAAVDAYIQERESSEGAWVQPSFGQQYLNQVQMPVYRLQLKIQLANREQVYKEERSIRLLPGRIPPFMSYFRRARAAFTDDEAESNSSE